ncbi:MAG: DUF1501 domain-containing protein [Armatimonadota bacterium]
MDLNVSRSPRGASYRSALMGATTERAWRGNVLVTLFLRGGADGLSVLVPHGDDGYHRQRPTLSLGTPSRSGVRDIDGFFGLHPALEPLERWFREGRMAGIHAIGSMDRSRSHFEAMATMERGSRSDPQAIPSGWLARAVESLPQPGAPLRSVAIGGTFPDILRGAAGAIQLRDLGQLRLRVGSAPAARLRSRFARVAGPLGDHGRDTFAMLEALGRIDPKSYKPSRGALYPTSGLGNGLRDAAILIKADVGTRAIALDRSGFDTHFAQGNATGLLASQLEDVAKSLDAFAKDLGPELDRVTVVVMTEFGRRVPENSQLGTDHGRAGAWLVLGNRVRGGKVHARWPSLAESALEPPGDLPVTTDYRLVLAECLDAVWDTGAADRVFANLPPKRLGVFSSAR